MNLKWDKKRAFDTPYDPLTGILFLACFVWLAVVQGSLLAGEHAEKDAVWWFAEAIKWCALILSLIVLSKVTLNAVGRRSCLKLLDSTYIRELVWTLAAGAAGITFAIALISGAGLPGEAERWSVIVLGMIWALVWVFGTSTTFGFPDNRRGG